MRTTTLLSFLASVVLVAAADPEVAELKRRIIKRQSLTAPGTGDAVILNFALTLEHLEATFYAQALANFSQADFTSAGFTNVYSQLQAVAADEATHVTFLTSALTAAGVTPVQACTYKFPYTNVASFLALSQVLEGVGVSAYLGAAGAINNTGYLLAAGSILTVEARHNAFVRYINGFQPAPQPFDTPASATAVVTLATPFFVSCPAGSAPTIAPFPSLNVTTTAPATGGVLAIAPTNASAVTATGTLYCGFASGLSSAYSVWANGSCPIPTANITKGQTYVFLTSGPSVSDATVLAGPAILSLESKANATSTNGTSAAAGASGAASSGAAASGTGAAGASSTAAARSSSNVVQASLLAFAGLVGVMVIAV